jgi:phosphoglycolate phosphatase
MSKPGYKQTPLSAKAILFDLDGTLVDTAPDFIRILNQQRQRHHLPPLDTQTIRDTVSDGARALTKLAFGGEAGETEFEARREELLALYAEVIGEDAQLFEGMEQSLQFFEAQNIPWGIVTNKPKRFTDVLLDRLSLTRRCAISICPDDVSNAKPDPESLLLACERLACLPEHVVYVGDHERDIIAGKAAGMRTIAVSYGYIMDPECISAWNADYLINHCSELISLFRPR